MVLLGAGPQDRQHLENLRESGKASLATGHISPPWFIKVGAALCRAVPCRAALRPAAVGHDKQSAKRSGQHPAGCHIPTRARHGCPARSFLLTCCVAAPPALA